MRILPRWLMPDAALALAVVTLAYALWLWDGPRRLFRDADSGWHIRTGERILSSASWPRHDSYSFTRQGRPWFAWEWGADVLMGAMYRLAGLGGVAWLYLCAIALSVWLWFRLHWIAGGNFWIACLMAAPMLSTANLHWLARPHVLGWVMTLLAIWRAERAGPQWRLRDAIVVTAGSALWANLHGSFILAPLIALVYGLGHWLRPRIWELDAAVEAARARWFLWAAALSVLGTMANPYGWHLHRHVAAYLSDSELLARIGEFQSFNFHAEGAGQILLCVGLAALGACAALSVRRLPQFFLLAALLVGGLRMARGLPLLALVGLPLANGAITAVLTRAASGGELRAAVRRRIGGFLAYGDRLRAIDAGLHGAALAPVVALLAFFWLRMPAVAARTGFPPDQFPVAAAARLETLPQDIRLLSPDKYGGYLIYRFSGQRKVFFDGRSDFYGAEYMKRYARLVQVRPGWRELVEEFGFTHALLPNEYSLVDALEAAGWRRIYRDDVATLLERPEARTKAGEQRPGAGFGS